jgi:hypothetical protein
MAFVSSGKGIIARIPVSQRNLAAVCRALEQERETRFRKESGFLRAVGAGSNDVA